MFRFLFRFAGLVVIAISFLGGLYVDDQLEFARSLDRQICRFCAMENLADQRAQRTIRVEQIGPVGDQPAGALPLPARQQQTLSRFSP